MQVKRFLVFSFDSYYPSGGWNDFKGSYDTLEEAEYAMNEKPKLGYYDNNHIVDSTTGKVVATFYPNHYR